MLENSYPIFSPSFHVKIDLSCQLENEHSSVLHRNAKQMYALLTQNDDIHAHADSYSISIKNQFDDIVKFHNTPSVDQTLLQLAYFNVNNNQELQ